MSTPVFPLDPPGIDANSNASLWFVPAFADINAPLASEVEAGVNLSCALYTFGISFEQATTSRMKYCYKEAVQSLGRTTRSVDRIRYDYDPQNPDSPEYGYYAELTPDRLGFLVDRRGIDAYSAPAGGQYVHITPVQLGDRDDVSIDPTAEGEKLMIEQIVAVIGAKRRDVQLLPVTP